MTFINRFHGSFNPKKKKTFKVMEGQAQCYVGKRWHFFASYRCLIASYNNRSETATKCDYDHSDVEKRYERKWLFLVDGASDFG